MPVIEAVLCDLDGTLVDSEGYHVQAWMEVANRHGVVLPEGWDADYVGKPDYDTAVRMLPMFPRHPTVKDLLRERHRRYQDLVAAHSQEVRYPGVESGLETLRNAGVKLGVGTNSPMENTTAALKAAGIDRLFEVIVAYGMVPNGKPAPDIYLAAAERLGVAPSACVVVEDTVVGIVSGKAAGCYVIAVSTTHQAEELRKEADLVLPDTDSAFRWIMEHNGA